MSSARSAKKKSPTKKSVAKAVKPAKAAVSSNATVEMCRELAAIVESHTLCELIVDTKEATLTLRRGVGMESMMSSSPMSQSMGHQQMTMAPPMQSAEAPVVEVAAPVVEDLLHKITSPFVGTFYRSPNPDSASYCEIGQRVEKGQVLCIIEAMKLMNEIEADESGTIEAILVENADPVEYGQPLFKIKV